jgi:RNA polymerase sigma-70 factor (ECF subfamily)
LTPREPPIVDDPRRPPDSSDRSLVEAVLRRDRKAVAEFVAVHADAIYTYVRRRLIPRVDLVDDLVQDVFLGAWEKLASFRSDAPLRSWLLGIARHKVEDYYRSRLREPDSEFDENVMLTDSLSQQAPDLDTILDREARRSRTQEVLQSLPEPYSLILLWRYWEQRSTQEIAAHTGRTEKAVERMLARARQQFKRRWINE